MPSRLVPSVLGAGLLISNFQGLNPAAAATFDVAAQATPLMRLTFLQELPEMENDVQQFASMFCAMNL